MKNIELINKLIEVHEDMKSRVSGHTSEGRPLMYTNDVSDIMKQFRETMEEYRETNNV